MTTVRWDLMFGQWPVSGSGTAHSPPAVHWSAQLMLIQDGEVLGDDAWGQPGEQRELFAGVLGFEQPHPFEAFDVTVDGLLGVVSAAGDLRGGQPFQVEPDDRRLVCRSRSHVGDVAANRQHLATLAQPNHRRRDTAVGVAGDQ
jgi:hypothetical protein